MRKIVILLMMGVLLSVAARADLQFSAPHVGRSDNRVVEIGASGTIKIVYTNRTGAAVNIDALKLFLDYESVIIDSISISHGNGAHLSVSENFAGGGSIRFQLRTDPATGQTPLPVANGDSVDLATVAFHVAQTPANVGRETYFIRFTTGDRVNNVQVVELGNNRVGTITDPADNPATAIHLEATHVPNFSGLNAVSDARVGNTVNLDWAANESGATDRTVLAETLYPSGTKLRYNLYRSATLGPRGDLVSGVINATGYQNGPGTGVPGSGMEQLSDCSFYYFILRGQDDCTATHNEEGNTNQLTVVPHDYTAPSTPADFAASAGDKTITLTWTNPGQPDFGGVVLIRKLGGYASPTFTNAAGDADGTVPPEVDTAPPGDGSAVVRYKGTGNRLVDSGLTNGTTYYYKIYAYDRAVAGPPREQGYNYSASAQSATAPGVAPSAIKNFIAISSPESGKVTLFWDKPPEDFYGGVIFWYTTDFQNKWDWYKTWGDAASGAIGLLASSPNEWLVLRDAGKIGVLAVSKTDPAVTAGQQESLVISKDLAGNNLDLSKVCFAKALAYNATGVDFPTEPAQITEENLRSRRYSDIRMAASLPAGAGGGSLTFNLKKYDPAKLIVNSISIPLNLKDDAGKDITRAGELIRFINEKAVKEVGKEIVISLGKWDSDTGNAVAVAPGKTENDFELKPGAGYQIYVTDDYTLTLQGKP